jgi:hypothetical protein
MIKFIIIILVILIVISTIVGFYFYITELSASAIELLLNHIILI